MSKRKLTLQERDLQLKRRDIVASLWARRMSQHEIQRAMANRNNAASFMVNPETGEPYDLSTIRRDIREIRSQHEKRIAASVDEHKAQQMIEIEELHRAAWAKKDLKGVATAIELKMKLTGTVSNNLNVNLKRKPVSVEEMSEEELDAIIAEDFARRSSSREKETESGA